MKWFFSLLMIAMIFMISAIEQAVDAPISVTDQVAFCIDNDVGTPVFTIYDANPSQDIPAFLTQHDLESLSYEITSICIDSRQLQNIAIIVDEGPMCKTKIPILSTVLLRNYIKISEPNTIGQIFDLGILNHDYEYG